MDAEVEEELELVIEAEDEVDSAESSLPSDEADAEVAWSPGTVLSVDCKGFCDCECDMDPLPRELELLARG